MPAIYRNLPSKCIEIIQFAFMCTICTRNLHHLEGKSNFAPGCKFAPTRCKFLKHRSHGQKYTRVQICTRVQIAHMNEALNKYHIKCNNLNLLKVNTQLFFFYFSCKIYLVIAYYLIPTTSVSLHTPLTVRAFMVLPMVPMVYQYRSRFYQWYHW